MSNSLFDGHLAGEGAQLWLAAPKKGGKRRCTDRHAFDRRKRPGWTQVAIAAEKYASSHLID